MGWADNYIKKLRAGLTITFRPRGNSMAPLIKSGQLVTVVPMDSVEALIEIGTVVLCKVSSKQYLHKVTGIRAGLAPAQYQISNNKFHVNGWTQTIYGVVTRVRD